MKKAVQFITALLLVAALAVSAGATSFTPSVEQKDAPVVTVVGSDKTVAVVPVSEADEAEAEVKASLEEAYASIESADSLEVAAPALAEALAAVAPELTVADLVVRDLMYVQVELADGESVVVNFDLGLEDGAVVIPMLFVNGEWVPVAPEFVTVNADGSVSVTFNGEVGVVAFVTVKAE